MNKYDLERQITKEFINEASDREGSYTRSLKRVRDKAVKSALNVVLPPAVSVGKDVAELSSEAGDTYDYSQIKHKMNEKDTNIYKDVRSLEGLVDTLQGLMRPEIMNNYFKEYGEDFAIAIINEALMRNRFKGDTYQLTYRGQGPLTRMLPKLNRS